MQTSAWLLWVSALAAGSLPCTKRCLFTESMTPRRAWKPPRTGNTCSMVSAMVASYRKRGETEVWIEERRGEEFKDQTEEESFSKTTTCDTILDTVHDKNWAKSCSHPVHINNHILVMGQFTMSQMGLEVNLRELAEDQICVTVNTGTWIILLLVIQVTDRSPVQPSLLASAVARELKITRIGFQEILNYGLAKLHRGHSTHTLTACNIWRSRHFGCFRSSGFLSTRCTVHAWQTVTGL